MDATPAVAKYLVFITHLYCLHSVSVLDASEVRREEDDIGDELHELGVDGDGGTDARQKAVVARLGLGRFVDLRPQARGVHNHN